MEEHEDEKNVYLQDIVTQFEHNNVLHPQIFLDPFHPFLSFNVFKSILVISVKSVHDITFKVFQQVRFALQLFRVHLDGIRFSYINRPLSTRSDIVEMATQKNKNKFHNSSPKTHSHFIRA